MASLLNDSRKILMRRGVGSVRRTGRAVHPDGLVPPAPVMHPDGIVPPLPEATFRGKSSSFERTKGTFKGNSLPATQALSRSVVTGGMMTGAAMGAVGGAFASGELSGNSILGGAIGGAIVGGALGSGMPGAMRKLSTNKEFVGRAGTYAGNARRVSSYLASSEGRTALFAGGGLLGGAAFGGSNSKKRGFNSHRGNSFSR